MQDIIVYVSLETQAPAKDTLLPLILSFEGAFPYKEYESAEAVAVDFAVTGSPAAAAAKALFDQTKLINTPGRIAKAAVFGVAADISTNDLVAALDTLRETQDHWYFLLPTTATTAQISALASWCAATVLTPSQLAAGAVEAEKMMIVQTTDKAAITENMRTLGQTVVCFNHDAANSYLPHAWVGRVAPNHPSSVTWKWKELYNVPVTDEAGTDMQSMLEDRYNLYIDNHGRNYMAEGICTDGNFIDTIIGRWQIKEAIRRNLVNLFVDNEVIPYDDAGFGQVGAEVIRALADATEKGIILKQNNAGVFVVNIPTRDQATLEQEANRIMPEITWAATLRGGVHGVRITGKLTVSLISQASA